MNKTLMCFIVAAVFIRCTEALWSFPGVEKHAQCLAQCNPVGNGTACAEGCTCRHKVDQPEHIETCLVTEIDPAPVYE
ncbi:uncharacterized protein LOC119174118 [Rhipicephalus microplus]|uniref:uncharacterized protein LOC119174118 n=1 Tax=Rhipicephalus microplus TaxID=6941 RepID=UPI003F6D09E7